MYYKYANSQAYFSERVFLGEAFPCIRRKERFEEREEKSVLRKDGGTPSKKNI